MLRSKPCKVCNSKYHTPGYHKPKKPLKHTPLKLESDKTRAKRRGMAAKWFRKNPPGMDGYWYCYLQISSLCPYRLNRSIVTLEHVYPKVKRPDLKFEIKNIKPGCSFCNKLKGSNTPEQLAKSFPHIAIMISKPEWKEWQAQLPIQQKT